MTPTNPDSADAQPERDPYEHLATATPAERTRTILQLIERHPLGRLELPQHGEQRAVLNGIDLSSEALGNIVAGLEQTPHWWNSTLRGASLRTAVLDGAMMEEANLSGADMAAIRLQGAALGKINLQNAMLEDAHLQGSVLRFAMLQGAILEGAELQQADMWGARLDGAILAAANLEGARLVEASLRKVDLSGANLKNAQFGKTDMRGANLTSASLQGADLADTNLEGAVLKGARLQGVSLSGCSIRHVHLSGARLDQTYMLPEQLGGAIGEELAKDYQAAKQAYLVLEHNFASLNNPDASSWAYRKRRRMQKLSARKRAATERAQGRVAGSIPHYLRYLGDQFVEWLCDYGESIPRVLAALFLTFAVFTVAYGVTGSVVRLVDTPTGTVRQPTGDLIEMATFSLVAMSTSGSPVVGLLPAGPAVHLLTALEAFIGIFLTGLLGYVAGNRIRR